MRDADAWFARERAALDGGLDVRAGRALVRRLLPVWVQARAGRVATKTAQTDAELLRPLSPALGALQIASVQPRHLDAWYQTLVTRGLGHSSIVRYRASMSSFFPWAIRESCIATDPAIAAPAPRDTGEPSEIWPFSEAELFAAGKSARDLLITGPDGGQLWAGALRRSLGWNVLGRGRRLHDLRHTAACLWLASGVDASTVQRWMGHQSLRTIQIYVHWLGTAADKASRELLNGAGGVYGVSGGNQTEDNTDVIAPLDVAE